LEIKKEKEQAMGNACSDMMKGHDSSLVTNHSAFRFVPETIRLESSSFPTSGPMPIKHCGEGIGSNISPEFHWSNLPSNTQEVVLMMEDPDAPFPGTCTHFILTGIPPTVSNIPEGRILADANPPLGYVFGKGYSNKMGWQGPAPPVNHGPHRYFVEIFALLTKLPPPSSTRDKAALIDVMKGKVVAKGTLVGTFERIG